MRKRSKYRPKEINLEAHDWAVQGAKPVSESKEVALRIFTRNHFAMTQITTGKAVKADLDTVVDALNMAETLAGHIGLGADHLPLIKAAMGALKAMAERGLKTGSFVFTGPQLQLVNDAMAIHDAQIEHPQCSVRLMEKCINHLRACRKSGKGVTVIKAPTLECVST